MAARVDNNVYFNGLLNSGGGGPITPTSPVDTTRKLPAQIYADGEVFPLQIEQQATGQSELCFATLNNSLVERGVVIDTSARTGALVGLPPYTPPLSPISFTQSAVVCGVTIPAQLAVYIDETGKFSFGSPIRKTIFFATMTGGTGAVALTDLTNNEAVFVLGIATSTDGGGGVFLYDSASNAVADGYNIFALTAPGVPGRLIRQRYEIAVNFFRDTLGVYADGTGVSRMKLHSLARGAGGADAAWSGLKAQRGTDADGAFTQMALVDNDRQGGAETPFANLKSYGSAFDVFQLLKPISLPAVALKTDIKAGRIARVTADERVWYNDADRGLAEILLSDGGPRASVATVADLRLLTPDGYQDGEVAIVGGYLFNGDTAGMAVYWSSGSTTADDGIDVFKPTLHTGGAAWTEAGRFLRLAPIRGQTFADTVAAPSAVSGSVWTVANTPPAGGYTNILIGNDREIVLRAGPVATVLKHNANGNAGRFSFRGGTDFPLNPGDDDIVLYQENGVVSIKGGTAAGGYQYLNANASLTIRRRYLLDSGGGTFTVTLPATPPVGSTIEIATDPSVESTAVTINPNGATIEGQAGNGTLNVGNAFLVLRYATGDWQVSG